MKPGTEVVVEPFGPLLQRSLTGTVVDPDAGERPGWMGDDFLLVALRPDANGLYGGRYWFKRYELIALCPDPAAGERAADDDPEEQP